MPTRDVTMDYDVVVVGAGPGGSSAARKCAVEGLKVVLLEKHQQPGVKLCAGGLDGRVLREFDIEDNIIQCRTKKSLFYAPGKRRSITADSATVYRKDFDPYLANRAVCASATLLTSCYCVGALIDGSKVIGVVARSPEGLKRYLGKVVIAADGFDSITAKSAGLQSHWHPSDVGLTVQREVRVKRQSETMEGTTHFFYGADVAPCGFGWIFPKKGGYTVGVGSVMSRLKRQPLLRNLEYLINEHPIASEILSELTGMSKVEAACVPLKPSSRLCGNGILVVGDAAGQVSPLGGDGIYYAMSAGTLAGKVATEASVEGDVSVDKLREYERLCFLKFGRELRVQRRILEMIEANYHTYMEAWILLNSHRLTRRICEAGSFIGKRVLARTLL